MKTLITFIVILSLIAMPVQESKGSIVAGICLIAVVTVMVGGVVVTVKQCKPKFFCIWDMMDISKGYWVQSVTRRELIANDWAVASGPYETVTAAKANCPPPTNAPVSLTSSMVVGGGGVAGYAPAYIHIEKSTNLVDWVEVATFIDDPTNFSWSCTNSIAEPTAFYRAWSN